MSYYLFPNQLKNIGWFIFIPACLLGVYIMIVGSESVIKLITSVFAIYSDSWQLFSETKNSGFFTIIQDDIVEEIVGILIIIGGSLVAFSKEKDEDELISKLRLESLVWAIYVNYSILILAIVFVYGLVFVDILIVNMFTILIIFIARFNYLLHKFKKANLDAEQS